MRAVPRERFVTPGSAEFAYEDSPLPIEENQTISQPYIVAAMLEAAEISSRDQVLEVRATTRRMPTRRPLLKRVSRQLAVIRASLPRHGQ
jgi:hypothetical protein